MRKYCYDENLIRKAVLSSTSYSEVLRKLKIPVQGNNITTLKKYINKYSIPTNHFIGSAKTHEWDYIPAEEYLKGLRVIHATKLLKKLYKEGNTSRNDYRGVHKVSRRKQYYFNILGVVVHLARTSVLQAEGSEFKSHQLHCFIVLFS